MTDPTNIDELRRLSGCTCPGATRDTTAAKIVCKRCGAEVVMRDPNSREEFARDIVLYTGLKAKPPGFAIASAEGAAARSPCQKSKRGASVYRMLTDLVAVDGERAERVEQTYADGYNGPPWIWDGDDPDFELACDGSEACRKSCGKRCVHAEQRALLALIPTLSDYSSALRMVHVELGPDGRVMAGKGPSCIDCSKLILDSGIGGIWLYETAPGVWFKDDKRAESPPGIWRYYTARAFHEATMTNLGIYQIRRMEPTS